MNEIERWRERVIKIVGDGCVAPFDSSARGIRCATAIVEDVDIR